MPQLWEITADHPSSTSTLHVLATHVLARARHASTGRIGLRPTPDGLGTGAIGPDNIQFRMSGATLVRDIAGNSGASTRTLPVDGRPLGELADFAGVDLDPAFSVGKDTPELPPADRMIHLDDGAARQVGAWFAFSDAVLVRLLTERPDSSPSGLQLWPEHFDLGTDLDAAPGGARANVGGSPGDGFISEPYLYVGPRSDARPGDPDYWNAPFGAALAIGELRSTDDPVRSALEFLHRGLDLLANG
jgi:hypothetical protein